MVKISVSILSKNDDNTILKLNKTDVDYFHIDVMDGKFVEEEAFEISKINYVGSVATKKLDVHLMVENPVDYIGKLSLSQIEFITFHYETFDVENTIKKIKSQGIKCGISVKPNTDIKDIFNLLDKVDLVLVMSVEPGYGGQEFMDSSLEKVKALKEELDKRSLNVDIAIDGGINGENARMCSNAGCDILISGSYIVNSEDYQLAINNLR